LLSVAHAVGTHGGNGNQRSSEEADCHD